ncbi:hypothetical protein IM284_07000 [Enterobacter cloacae complex sp. P12RS]|nr:hypothetical protein [Enterobacter cloacae complex sp. P12RS]
MQPDIARDFIEIHLSAELRAVCDLGYHLLRDALRRHRSEGLPAPRAAG